MRFLITGAYGQDGRYLVSALRKLGNEVVEVGRTRSRYFSNGVLAERASPRLEDPIESIEFLNSQQPDCILHFAAIHFPAMIQNGDFDRSEMIACHFTTTQNFLNWILERGQGKLIVALSSQMYSTSSTNSLINEQTALNPSTFYGKTKSDAFELIRLYRDSYNVNASGAILFNHTSSRSKKDFLFPFLAASIRESIRNGYKDIVIRNASATVDIGSSDEYCEGVISMASENQLTDYVFASGVAVSISKIVQDALRALNLEDKISVSSRSEAPSDCLVGNSIKAQRNLLWAPRKKGSEILVEMVEGISKSDQV